MTSQTIWQKIKSIIDVEHFFETSIKVLLIIIASILIYYFVKYLIKRLFSLTIRPKRFRINEEEIKKRQKTIEQVVLSIWQYVMWVIALLLILAAFGINIQTILAGAGIIGVIFAVGSQRLIQDFLDGFFNIFEDNMSVGDYVAIDGVEGTIIDIGLRDIKIKSWSGEVHIIPNSKIGHFINYSLDHGKAIVEIKISYETLPEKVIAILNDHFEEIKKGNPNILTTPQIAGVNKLDELGYDIRITCNTTKETHWSVQRYIRKELIHLFSKHDIKIGLNQIKIVSEAKDILHHTKQKNRSNNDQDR